jgi:lipoate-protein ligase A
MTVEFNHPTADLLQTVELGGRWQMALDAALLQRRRPVLRLYRWSRPTLSLGFHQRSLRPAWRDWQRQGLGDLVRRPSGGGAVLHGGDLCYALIWPDPPCTRQQAYAVICRWLVEALAPLGEPLQFGQQQATGHPDCFARSTSADLVNRQGIKRVGSAQRWQNGCLLQHGSIQLNPDTQTWAALLDGPPPNLAPLAHSGDALVEHLVAAARRWLPLPGLARPLDAELLSQAGTNLETYGVAPGDDSSETSPLASIERTT